MEAALCDFFSQILSMTGNGKIFPVTKSRANSQCLRHSNSTKHWDRELGKCELCRAKIFPMPGVPVTVLPMLQLGSVDASHKQNAMVEY